MDFLQSTLYNAPLDGSKPTSLMSSRPQKKYSRCMPPTNVQMPPPRSSKYEGDDIEDDLPTPRANPNIPNPENISNPITSPGYPEEWRIRLSSASTEFEEDDIYGTIIPSDDEYVSSSDDGSEIVPFQVSNSIKKLLKRPKGKADPRLSVVIPSPAMWPTVDKLQKSCRTSTDLPLSPQTPLSPAALARLAANNALLVPSQSTAPSLADSSTSDGVSSLSCPSTPDLRSKGDDDDDDQRGWDIPTQLTSTAMETLLFIHPDCPSESELDIIGHANRPTADQQSTPPMAERGLKISLTIPVSSPELNEEEFSALSIPSPGGFFASLADSSSVWAFPQQNTQPSTSTAETFYDVPWRKAPPKPLERVVELEEALSDGPPTARRITEELQSTSATTETETVPDGVDYDDEYERKLHESATANMSRTSVWLAAQQSYLDLLNKEDFDGREDDDTNSPKTPVSSTATKASVDDASTVSPSSKKSVRFADVETKSTASTEQSGMSVPSDSLFYHAFQHTCKDKTGQDAFTNREVRAEAVRAERHYLPSIHRARLTNTFALTALKESEKGNECWRAGPTDAKAESQRELLASVNKEQQALQQISLSSFYLDADRFLNQGSLLPQSIASAIKQQSKTSKRKPRILDLGGEPTASWGWAVALEYRSSKVYTVVPASHGQSAGWTAHRGPSNHRTVTVPNAWTLPFPSNSFDLVSARSLHSMLRNTNPTRDGGDEYDATLAEIKRILAPGGFFHFSVMDAEVTAPANSSIAARSIEFAVSLRTRGYDSCAGRRLVAKLDKAGFSDVKRTWMSLPIGGEEPNGMAALTGLFGSLAWEKWMLKLQMETGRPEERLLDGIAKAFDEAKGSSEGASWRMLVGCAQKS